MKYDFDNIVDRRNTGSLKWDKYAGRDILPMWVADMDFRCPPQVIEALHQHVNHGIFGYSAVQGELIKVVVDRLKLLYDWDVDPHWIVWLPGLVPGLNLPCRCTGGEGDEVACFVPAYPPFLIAPKLSRQTLKSVPLSRGDNRFYMEPEKFKQALNSRTKLCVICNPHNPVGREYRAEELKAIVEICLENGIVVCSDEIHCDLILDDINHVPTALLSEEIAQNTITLLAPSKTFNIPGLNCGLAVISNDQIRQKFSRLRRDHLPDCNVLGLIAARAAYQHGEDWRRQLIKYLRRNRDLIAEFIKNEIPLLSMDHIEATYLAWVDVSLLNEADPIRFFENAGVGLSDGRDYEGPGYVRLNFGCPQKVLLQALEKMKQAVAKKIETSVTSVAK